MNDTKIEIFTDGACRGNPGPGGWGALLRCGAYTKELSGSEPFTTNNRMELSAVIFALKALKNVNYPIVVTTDSKYVHQGAKEWINKWEKNLWRTHDNDPIKNLDLWQELWQIMKPLNIDWQWTKGHNGHPDNERVDKLANEAIDNLLKK